MSNPNPLQIYLSFLGSAFMLTPDPYRLLLPVDTALRECGERVESLRDEADVEWAEQVAEDVIGLGPATPFEVPQHRGGHR